MQLSLFNPESQGQATFFGKKRKWSTAKHRIMLKFIQGFAYKFGRTINYVDGFAGDGRYDEGFGLEDFIKESKFWNKHGDFFKDTDGSPLIALKCAKIFKDENRLELRSFFSELSRDTNQTLRKNCEDFCTDSDIYYRVYDSSKFNLVLPKILEDLCEHPSIFFLDPFGVKGVTFNDIAQAANYVSQYKGEVFLLFNNRAVARNSGHYKEDSQLYKDEKDLKSSQTYNEHLTNLLGPNSEVVWQEHCIKYRDIPQKFERWALDFFKLQLKQYTQFKGVTSYEIKESYNDRPQYSIVVGSNHPQSAFGDFLNEFFHQEEKRLFYEVDVAGSNTRFMDQEWNKQEQGRIEEVSERVLAILENTKEWITVKDLITEIILEIEQVGFLSRKTYRNFIEMYFNENKLVAKNLGRNEKLTLNSYVKWYN